MPWQDEEEHPLTPARPTTGCRLWLGRLALLLVPAVAFATLLWLEGGVEQVLKLELGHDRLIALRLGDYQWTWPLTQCTLLRFCGFVAFVVCFSGCVPSAAERALRRVRTAICGCVVTFITALSLCDWLNLISLELAYWMLAAALGVLAAFLFRASFVRRLLEWNGNPVRAAGTMAAATAGLVILTAGSWLLYRFHPVFTDAQSQVLQARLLLAGRWCFDMPQSVRQVIAMVNSSEAVPAYSFYPPGHIVVLMLPLACGISACSANIVVGAVIVAITVVLADRLAAPPAGWFAAFLLLCSPMFLAMQSSAMNHSTSALGLLVTAWFLLQCHSLRRPWRAGAAAGLALGFAAATRPYTAAAHALAWAANAAVLLVPRQGKALGCLSRRLRLCLRFALGLGAGLALPAILTMCYNAHTTGSALVFGYQTTLRDIHQLGFRASGPYAHSLTRAVAHFLASGVSFNAQLFGWGIGSWAALVVWCLRTRLRPWERSLLAVMAVHCLMYMYYHGHDLLVGPRFHYELLPFLVLLAASALADAWRRAGPWRPIAVAVITLLSLSGLATGVLYWRDRYEHITARHDVLAAFMRKTLPVRRPTAICLIREHEEAVAMWYPVHRHAVPIWFVPDYLCEKARSVPDLMDCSWLQEE